MPTIVKLDRDAPFDCGPVADIAVPLQAVLEAHCAHAEWINRPDEGGWIRSLGLVLDSGRLAYLEERRAYPGEFTVYLTRHRDLFYRKADFEEVRHFLDVAEDAVKVLTGQVRWWKR